MFKRIICFLCFICLMGSVTAYAATPCASVSESTAVQSIVLLKNGDCLMISAPKVLSVQRGTITGEKHYSYRASDGTIRWTATLTGTFTYNGSTATCTAASCETSVQQGNWHETYNHAYPSGNTAQADVTMVRKVLFITVQTETAHLILTCDGNGNLS